MLSKSNIIIATKYSPETTELNWRCGLSCAVSVQFLEKNEISNALDEYSVLFLMCYHAARSFAVQMLEMLAFSWNLVNFLTHLTRDPWPDDPLSSLRCISLAGARAQQRAGSVNAMIRGGSTQSRSGSYRQICVISPERADTGSRIKSPSSENIHKLFSILPVCIIALEKTEIAIHDQFQYRCRRWHAGRVFCRWEIAIILLHVLAQNL